MADSDQGAAPGPGGDSRLKRARDRLTPKQGTLYVIGVMLMVSVALIIVASIAYGILASRKSYFEQRNLRELDRIAAELNTTREGLAQAATLHFVPQQLDFSLSRQVECLVATTTFRGGRQELITITYYFTDPAGTGGIADWYAGRTPQRVPATQRTAPPVEREELPDDICQYERPLGLTVSDETVTLGSGQMRLERTAHLRNLLWPMVASPASGQAPGPESCGERTAGSPTAEIGDLRAYVRQCLQVAAMEDLARGGYAYRTAAQIQTAVTQSLTAAFTSNTVRINVATPTAALDLDSSLEIFDAVQVIGSDSAGRPVLLHQAGRVPAAIEGDASDEERVLNALAGFARTPAGGAPTAGQTAARQARQGDFLAESRIFRTSDLILFQRTLPRLAGLSCNPCQIVGIAQRSKFDERVRKIDGVQATVFLIGVLTLIGLIPLLQLRLRKHLDATGRAGQHILWISLTLLAASASVSVLAIWSSAASRNAGAARAHDVIGQLVGSFRTELDESLRLVSRLGAQLGPNTAVYPAPSTLPLPGHLTPQGAFGADPRRAPEGLAPVEVTLSTAWDRPSAAAIIDTVAYYRGDGFIDRDAARVAAGLFPSFGTTISDRAYFHRARNRDFDVLPLHCEGGDVDAHFIVDRVFARPDGAPRVVFVMPVKHGCPLQVARAAEARAAPVSPAARPARPRPRSRAAGDRLAPVYSEDLRPFYNPTRPELLVGSGTLRTFLGPDLGPGFSYAIIDPDRPRDQADVLYHSRSSAELVERFESEVDDPERFRALVDQAQADRGTETEAEDGTAVWSPSEFRMDTNYRARPARLTVARLHPSTDWIAVIVENRDDAGFAVWRAATFGYAIWFIGAVILVLTLLVRRKSPSVDRRPGLSLWPRERLAGFTPPRIERHADMAQRLVDAAALRDRHIWWVLWACLIGIPAAEGLSRVLFALAAAVAVLAARAYFRGLTTTEAARAMRFDRWVTIIAIALLALTLLAFLPAIAADYQLRRFIDSGGSWFDLVPKLRFIAFLVAAGLLGRCLLAALTATAAAPPEPAPEAGRLAWFWHWLRVWRPRQPRRDIGWLLALIILGGVPAAAGFLDSYDQDRYLLFDRTAQAAREASEQRRQAIYAIDMARLAKLPRTLIQDVSRGPEPAPDGGGRPDTRSCITLSCLALLYLDLREQALDYSDFPPFQMRDAFTAARGGWRLATLPVMIALITALLVLALLFFRQQYFRPPPILSPGKDPVFDPPLSLTRDQFIAQALLKAAKGETPALPFAPAGGNRHLILGVGLDLRDDWAPGQKLRLGTLPPSAIQWVDLLEPPETVAIEGKAVVIGNLDLALQVSDQASIRRTFNIINTLSESYGTRRYGGPHVFLLADIDPLDRIGLLCERQERGDMPDLIEGWRWAELIQDFTLFPIRPGPAVPYHPGDGRVLRVIREELGVLDTAFARELADQLHARIAGAPGNLADNLEEAERIVAFITEQMSDHYYKLWASSSDEERVMLYRVARDCFLKMPDSRGLRSLLARGLLIRVPEYRLINRSFARYVCRVGATMDIGGRAREIGGVDRIWPLIRFPLAAVAGSAVLLLQFVAPSTASSAVGALPALLALAPALIGKWFQDRGAAT